MGENDASPVYAVYFPADIAKSPRNVFTTLKEAVAYANSPEGKSNGARFNRFGTPKEVMDFFASGECRSPLSQTSVPAVASEPTIPHPSVSRIQMNDLKRAIEKGTFQTVCDLISSNPRFLINTNGDTAAIVMEGFRFNALHIAGRHGKADVTSKILQLVGDTDFLASVYGTSKEDAEFRASNIIASYLNTPDKGNCETPLHLAAKFGHVDVVRVLVEQPLMDRHLLNIEGKTAFEIACSRYNGSDKRMRKEEIELLLGGFFIAAYRSVDNSVVPKIVSSETHPKATLSIQSNGICSPLLPEFKLAAYAGPFGSKSKAMDFFDAWVGSEKHVKLSDMDKGYERVGRELSAKHNVKWAESWCFLDQMVDLRFDEGLSALNSHLGRLKLKESLSSGDSVRRRLDYDGDDDDSPRMLTPEEEEHFGEEDEFEDAAESAEEIDQMVLNDSLAGLSERLLELTLNSPGVAGKSISSVPKDLQEFFTPPATPPPVFLLEHPTKVDNDVMIALANVPQDQINRFPHVRQFTDKLRRFASHIRSEWPSLDSPRRGKASSRIFAK